MYHYLKGIFVKRDTDRIIVENNGIGYEIFTSINSIEDYEVNSEVKVYTRLIVKDEDIILIGFASILELEVFELLKTVSGVGIKSSLGILNVLGLNHVISAVVDEDFALLTTVSGIGKKTAQRIVIELKDKFSKKYGDQFLDNDAVEGSQPLSSISKSKQKDVRDALTSLGYSPSEVNHVIKMLDTNAYDLETLIKEALKLLMKG